MKSIVQLFSLLVSSAFLIMVTFACSGPEPVATQYKNSNPNGAAVAAPGPGGNPGGGNNNGGDNTGDGDATGGNAPDPALIAQGETVFSSKCAVCHTAGPGPEIAGQGYSAQDFVDSSEIPIHGGVEWPTPEDAAALEAFANQ